MKYRYSVVTFQDGEVYARDFADDLEWAKDIALGSLIVCQDRKTGRWDRAVFLAEPGDWINFHPEFITEQQRPEWDDMIRTVRVGVFEYRPGDEIADEFGTPVWEPSREELVGIDWITIDEMEKRYARRHGRMS